MKNIFIQSCFIILAFISCDEEYLKTQGTREIKFEVVLTNKATDSLDLIFWNNKTSPFAANINAFYKISFISNNPQKFKTQIRYAGIYGFNIAENVLGDFPASPNTYLIYSLDDTLLVGTHLSLLDSVSFVFNKKKIISFNVRAQTNNTRQFSDFIVADKLYPNAQPYPNLAFMNKLATQNLVFPQKLLDSAQNIN